MSPGLSRSEEKVKGSIDGSVDHSLEQGTDGETPPPLRNYIFLTIFTCFCPAWPINIVALVFSMMCMCVGSSYKIETHSQSSYDNEDYDGARRLGRKALHMGIASFIIGILIIMTFCIVHFTTSGDEIPIEDGNFEGSEKIHSVSVTDHVY
ncbi:transmembrane protein 233-like [Silurus meridionalis]|nr:transmembrane protein 233-like [Silurus meridionalis]